MREYPSLAHDTVSMTALQGGPPQVWTPQSVVALCAPNAALSSRQVRAEVPLHVKPLLAHKMQTLLAEAPQVLQPSTPARPAPSALRPASHLMAAAIANAPRNSSKAAAGDMPHSNSACFASALGGTHPDPARQPVTVIGLGSAAAAAPGSLESLPTGLFSIRSSLNASGHHGGTDTLHMAGSLAMAGSSRVPVQALACQRQTPPELPPVCASSQGVQAGPAQSPPANQPVPQALPAKFHSAPEADEQWDQNSGLAPVNTTTVPPHLQAVSANLAFGQTAPQDSLHGSDSEPRRASCHQKPAGNGGSSQGPNTPEPPLEGGPGNGPAIEVQQTDCSARFLSQASRGSKQADEVHEAQQSAVPAKQGGCQDGVACAKRPSEDLAGAGASDVHAAHQTIQVGCCACVCFLHRASSIQSACFFMGFSAVQHAYIPQRSIMPTCMLASSDLFALFSRLDSFAPDMAIKAEPYAGLMRSGRQPACPAQQCASAARPAYTAQRRACCPACDCSCIMPVHRAGHGQECLCSQTSAPGGCPEAQGVTGEALLQERLCNAGLPPSLRQHASGMP